MEAKEMEVRETEARETEAMAVVAQAPVMQAVAFPAAGGGGEGRGAGGWGNRNAQVQKTQAKRAFFELVHCLAPKRPGSPALTGFPEPPAPRGPKLFGSGSGGVGWGAGVQEIWGRNAPKV